MTESWHETPTEKEQLEYKIYKLEQETARLREALNEIKKTVEDAQDTVYPFHIALDSKDAVYILEITKESLKGEDE